MNDGGRNCIGCFEIKIETDAAKFANVGIAGFGQSGYLIGEGQVLIEDKTKVVGRVGSFNRRGMELGWLLFESDQKEFGFRRV